MASFCISVDPLATEDLASAALSHPPKSIADKFDSVCLFVHVEEVRDSGLRAVALESMSLEKECQGVSDWGSSKDDLTLSCPWQRLTPNALDVAEVDNVGARRARLRGIALRRSASCDARVGRDARPVSLSLVEQAKATAAASTASSAGGRNQGKGAGVKRGGGGTQVSATATTPRREDKNHNKSASESGGGRKLGTVSECMWTFSAPASSSSSSPLTNLLAQVDKTQCWYGEISLPCQSTSGAGGWRAHLQQGEQSSILPMPLFRGRGRLTLRLAVLDPTSPTSSSSSSSSSRRITVSTVIDTAFSASRCVFVAVMDTTHLPSSVVSSHIFRSARPDAAAVGSPSLSGKARAGAAASSTTTTTTTTTSTDNSRSTAKRARTSKAATAATATATARSSSSSSSSTTATHLSPPLFRSITEKSFECGCSRTIASIYLEFLQALWAFSKANSTIAVAGSSGQSGRSSSSSSIVNLENDPEGLYHLFWLHATLLASLSKGFAANLRQRFSADLCTFVINKVFIPRLDGARTTSSSSPSPLSAVDRLKLWSLLAQARGSLRATASHADILRQDVSGGRNRRAQVLQQQQVSITKLLASISPSRKGWSLPSSSEAEWSVIGVGNLPFDQIQWLKTWSSQLRRVRLLSPPSSTGGAGGAGAAAGGAGAGAGANAVPSFSATTFSSRGRQSSKRSTASGRKDGGDAWALGHGLVLLNARASLMGLVAEDLMAICPAYRFTRVLPILSQLGLIRGKQTFSRIRQCLPIRLTRGTLLPAGLQEAIQRWQQSDGKPPAALVVSYGLVDALESLRADIAQVGDGIGEFNVCVETLMSELSSVLVTCSEDAGQVAQVLGKARETANGPSTHELEAGLQIANEVQATLDHIHSVPMALAAASVAGRGAVDALAGIVWSPSIPSEEDLLQLQQQQLQDHAAAALSQQGAASSASLAASAPPTAAAATAGKGRRGAATKKAAASAAAKRGGGGATAASASASAPSSSSSSHKVLLPAAIGGETFTLAARDVLSKVSEVGSVSAGSLWSILPPPSPESTTITSGSSAATTSLSSASSAAAGGTGSRSELSLFGSDFMGSVKSKIVSFFGNTAAAEDVVMGEAEGERGDEVQEGGKHSRAPAISPSSSASRKATAASAAPATKSKAGGKGARRGGAKDTGGGDNEEMAAGSTARTSAAASTAPTRTQTYSPQSGVETITYSLRRIYGSGHDGSDVGREHYARMRSPTASVELPDGRILIADSIDHRLRLVLHDGEVVYLCHRGLGHRDGGIRQAQFNRPCGLAVMSDGVVVVADSGNRALRIIDAELKTVQTVNMGTGRGPLELARPVSLATGHHDEIYVADKDAHCIRVLRKTEDGEWVLTVFAGEPQVGGHLDGPVALDQQNHALLDQPSHVSICSDGALVFTEIGSHTVRIVRGSKVSTIGGTPKQSGNKDGPRGLLHEPSGVVEVRPNLFIVADKGNNRLRVLSAGNHLRTLIIDTPPTIARTACEVRTNGLLDVGHDDLDGHTAPLVTMIMDDDDGDVTMMTGGGAGARGGRMMMGGGLGGGGGGGGGGGRMFGADGAGGWMGGVFGGGFDAGFGGGGYGMGGFRGGRMMGMGFARGFGGVDGMDDFDDPMSMEFGGGGGFGGARVGGAGRRRGRSGTAAAAAGGGAGDDGLVLPRLIRSGLKTPCGLVVLKDGTLLVAEPDSCRVTRLRLPDALVRLQTPAESALALKRFLLAAGPRTRFQHAVFFLRRSSEHIWPVIQSCRTRLLNATRTLEDAFLVVEDGKQRARSAVFAREVAVALTADDDSSSSALSSKRSGTAIAPSLSDETLTGLTLSAPSLQAARAILLHEWGAGRLPHVREGLLELMRSYAWPADSPKDTDADLAALAEAASAGGVNLIDAEICGFAFSASTFNARISTGILRLIDAMLLHPATPKRMEGEDEVSFRQRKKAIAEAAIGLRSAIESWLDRLFPAPAATSYMHFEKNFTKVLSTWTDLLAGLGAAHVRGVGREREREVRGGEK